MIDEEYHHYLGNVTVNGLAYAKCMLTLNVPLMAWRTRELTHTMTIFAKYSDDTTADSNRLYMGDTTGKVFDKAKYTDTTVYQADGCVSTVSDGTAIASLFELAPFVVDPENFKALTQIVSYTERAGGLKLLYRIVDGSTRDIAKYQPITQLTSFINEAKISASQGQMIQIAGTEVGKDPYWKYFGTSYDLIPTGKP